MWLTADNESIYRYYLKQDPIVGFKYMSPFRNDNNNPSLSFYYSGKNNELKWTDFGSIEYVDGITTRDGIAFVMQMEGLSRKEAIEFINKNIKSDSVFKEKHEQVKKLDPTIKIRNYWKPFEIDYWKRVSLSLIAKSSIYPIESYGYGDDLITSTEDSPAFFYLLNKDIKSYKVYRPYETINKWKSAKIANNVECSELLPNYRIDRLVITSSKKDSLTVMTYYDVFAINPPSENIWAGIYAMARDLNARSRIIDVWLDLDRTGIMNTKKVCNATGWNPIILNNDFRLSKDQFGIINKDGVLRFKSILK